MIEALETCFIGPNAVASACLLLVFAVCAISALGALDLEIFSGLDVGAGVDGAGDALFLSMLMVPLRILNLGRVPVMIWLMAFAWIYWAVSLAAWHLWDVGSFLDTTGHTVQLAARNALASLVLTKMATEPLKDLFESKQAPGGADLIGQPCEVWSHHADASFGQGRFQREGSPLLMRIRTSGQNMEKGEIGIIASYDEGTNVYLIEPDRPGNTSLEESSGD